ncbi:S-adenosyl-L-methionine-dependent methyltransferase [Lobosporangium transversale]|uniref:S-adenosyl-L-methionine-dependent methyltransferase n=1 Tax=Lobosporangium transversale TaxID=64571 RepID=A0A1Y2G9K6_9FUNG|nr:S-adenosyl-L-methionine-dependent methyltransferase [Lobosporangium transversale]ORY95974.1 S-adenosyl-L-methionine-dependent methyltransferase [Lobosporangium transversale]|eukprot:XP_021875415.1 S-adenosyl-L-methionine-dependent methyltransferase [Lobosporangium transversale]
MGTNQSSSRSSKDSAGGHGQYQIHSSGSGHGKYSSRNSSGTHLDRPHNGSSPFIPGNHSNNSSSLQKALSRRRSSNRTIETSSSHGSISLNNNSSDHYRQHHHSDLPSHQEEGEDDFKYYHGRRYHNTSSLYMLPNDSQEVDRLHLQHYIYKVALDKNIHVPIPENGRVMDFGCGPATWTMDMATEMSTINFVGVDISPIYPTAIYPRNCNFYNEDILQGVSQPDNVFDVVFQRNLTCGFTFEHWQKAMNEAYRILKPGGYYECVETDVAVQNAGPQTNLVFEHLRVSMAARGVDPSIVRSLDRLLAAAGFTEVHVKEYTIPVGEWGDKVGQLWKQNMFQVLDTVKPHLAKAARISEGQVQEVVNAMHQETAQYRSSQIVYVAYGRKPL